MKCNRLLRGLVPHEGSGRLEHDYFHEMDVSTAARTDRILVAEEVLTPSSGFVSAVMERVQEEAAAPKPIPFPWKRVLPGAVVAISGVAWIGVQAARQGLTHVHARSGFAG